MRRLGLRRLLPGVFVLALIATASASGAVERETSGGWNPLAQRWEAGVAIPEGHFQWLGSAAHHRVVRDRNPFAQILRAEVAGGSQGYLSEGAASVYYLFQPHALARTFGPVSAALEFGPGGHLAVQFASIDGFDESGVHARAFLKSHAYGWLVLRLGSRVGLGVSGRFSVPNHRPLDYAQAVVLFK